ncbi:hypothetical protein LM6186_60167 [Listeria monocytogenes]|nr:hypothetical protein LMQOC2_20492 [Listeria monocytogenes QOC2]CDK41980.1 hypothetical protein LMQOC1_30177 [Listeria monocytogenes QOC1]CUK56221.1 hypothetical protein LM57179_80171 [Listeria monocytogenes]CUK60272.1 hypothetical protein LM600727_30181 [Listeria monocytogenes]CUK87521.1 hypothetical protein LM6186_60167 [Listeria monocytogenes]
MLDRGNLPVLTVNAPAVLLAYIRLMVSKYNWVVRIPKVTYSVY